MEVTGKNAKFKGQGGNGPWSGSQLSFRQVAERPACWRCCVTLSPRRSRGGTFSARAKITSGFSESFGRGIVAVPKIRNKLEGPKFESQNQAASHRFEPWSFRVLILFRISGFGFVGPQMLGGPLLEFRPEAGLCFCTYA